MIQFETQCGGIIQVSRGVFDVFQSFRQLSDESEEAGGILVGRVLLNGDVIVDYVTSPSKEDKSTRFSFFRPIRLAQQFIVNIWRKSRGTQNYLGEWHTHPEDLPCPSATDISNWMRIWRDSKVDIDELFFIIIGRKAVKVWSLTKDSETPSNLKPRKG